MAKRPAIAAAAPFSAELPAGQHASPDMKIPDEAEGVTLRLPRKGWPAQQGKRDVRVRLWVSYDNGRAWQFLIGGTMHGNGVSAPHAQPVEESAVKRRLKPRAMWSRWLRVELETVLPLPATMQVEYW